MLRWLRVLQCENTACVERMINNRVRRKHQSISCVHATYVTARLGSSEMCLPCCSCWFGWFVQCSWTGPADWLSRLLSLLHFSGNFFSFSLFSFLFPRLGLHKGKLVRSYKYRDIMSIWILFFPCCCWIYSTKVIITLKKWASPYHNMIRIALIHMKLPLGRLRVVAILFLYWKGKPADQSSCMYSLNVIVLSDSRVCLCMIKIGHNPLWNKYK